MKLHVWRVLTPRLRALHGCKCMTLIMTLDCIELTYLSSAKKTERRDAHERYMRDCVCKLCTLILRP